MNGRSAKGVKCLIYLCGISKIRIFFLEVERDNFECRHRKSDCHFPNDTDFRRRKGILQTAILLGERAKM